MEITSYIYTFIRKDLSYEQKIIQIGHACYEAGKRSNDTQGISNLVLLKAEDEEDLKNIARKLDIREIEFYMFYEPDITSYTAICTGPLKGAERNFFKKYDLYKEIGYELDIKE